MSARVNAKDLPGVDGFKKYTVTDGVRGAIGFFIGVFVSQLAAFCGIFFATLGQRDDSGNNKTAWWSFCLLGNSIQGITGLTNALRFPVTVERRPHSFTLVSLAGCRVQIPLSEVESVGVGEMRRPCFKTVPCVEITVTERFSKRRGGCGCCYRHIKIRVDEWNAFLADNSISTSTTGYGKAMP